MNDIDSGELLRAPDALARNRNEVVGRGTDRMANAVRAMGLSTEEIDVRFREILTYNDLLPSQQDSEPVPNLDVTDVRQRVQMAAPTEEHYDQWRRMASDSSAPGGLN